MMHMISVVMQVTFELDGYYSDIYSITREYHSICILKELGPGGYK